MRFACIKLSKLPFKAVLITAISLMSVSITNANSPDEDFILKQARSAVSRATTDLLRLEPHALTATNSNASRSGNTLTIKIKKTQNIIFRDSPDCQENSLESKCVRYAFIAHASTRHIFVVAKLSYEDIHYFLIDDRSGISISVNSFPIISGDGCTILQLIENDEEFGFGIQIFHHSESGFRMEWAGHPFLAGQYTSYKFIKWLPNSGAEIEISNDFGPNVPESIHKIKITRSDGSWHVEPIEGKNE